MLVVPLGDVPPNQLPPVDQDVFVAPLQVMLVCASAVAVGHAANTAASHASRLAIRRGPLFANVR
ncbi:MAG: hypothetical protein NTW36_04820 [Planctomycetia bacterium]|nr:hypothetical protein [Planctomycetia bacterium]